MSSLQAWVSEHKLASVGTLWASAVGASLAYARGKAPLLKPSVRLIHARMHAQALTLAVLSGAAVVHYYEGRSSSAPAVEGRANATAAAAADLFDTMADADW